ncbi:protein artichoke-like [Cimex lectularius]|uniref:LRRCT domain-containing protein n=1 Tax=Cimex lectularius TaxID=79782 RepID=A0A8I6RXE6_CIMLE|nr:protein artichoke-like [Cimex lectularius]
MWYSLWWHIVGIGLLVITAHACPPPETITPCLCTTRADELQIWCSHSELSPVLSGLQAVGAQLTRPIDELILENNAMTALPGRAFAPLRVVRLMLRDNKLERVAANWLAGLEESLLEVFIVEPELKSLPEDSFDTLLKMEAVTLKAGFVPRMPNFSGLSRLKYIQTELPSMSELTPGRINNLEMLEMLQIVGSKGLKTLEASALQDLPRLVTVNFTGCGITWIHPRAMMRLPSLKELSFSFNNIIDAGEVGRSIRELPHLAVVKVDNNQIDELRETSFVDIPPLKEIYLNMNKIKEVQRGAFHRLPSLSKIDLSDNNIKRIFPEFYLQSYDSRVEELNLMNNEIDHIMALTIIMETLPQLKFLDVSKNKLQDIMFGALRGHPTLERLHINDNHLKRVVREAFTAMPALRELRLRNNSLSNYLEMPLWNLPALKGLDLAHNEFRRLDRRVLANLPSLRRLDVSKNNLLVVDPASFLGTPALEHVNLSHNAIEVITPQTLPHLNNLFDLDVGSNRLRSIVPGLPRALEYLYMSKNQITALPRAPSSDLLLPSLKLLDFNGNSIQSLPPEGFISMPLLRKLFLGENSIQKIDERSFEGLGRLEKLELHDNKLNAIHENAFRDLRRLRELSLKSNRLNKFQSNLLRENDNLNMLDLSHNQLIELTSSTFDNNRKIREISLSHNAFSSFPEAVKKLPELENLDLSYNRIQQLIQPLSNMKSLSMLKLTKNKLQTLIDSTFSNMDNLTLLDLESNEIQYLTPHVVRSMPSLQTLKLAKNKLSTIPSAAFSDLPQLTDVELQENLLTHLASDSFTGVPNLLFLNLSHNLLTGLDRAGLHGLKSMEILDISHNKVSRLNTPGLPNLDSLIQLKMDDNKICTIQGSPFSKMSHLRMLSLRNNKLISLSENAFQPLRSTIYQLDIEGNPLKCSCSLLWLQSWVREGPYQGPRCSDGSLLKEFRLSREDCAEPKSFDHTQNCEDSPTLGQTQQLYANNWKDMHQKPLPEETDYFYEDYIEYEENVTLPSNFSQQQQKQPQQVVASSTDAPILILTTSTHKPAAMSHFIPGDTPTLYAKPGSVENKFQKPSSKPGTSFTFFGMPLPYLNIDSFWGSSRNSDGKTRFPGAKGRVQQVTSPPKVEDGFRPMLPSTGGFKPIFNPYNRTEEDDDKQLEPVKLTPKPSVNSSRWDIKTNNLPTILHKKEATITKVQPEKTDNRITGNDQIAQLTDNVYNQKNHTEWPAPQSSSMGTTQPIFQYNRLEPELEVTTPLLESLPDDIQLVTNHLVPVPTTTKRPAYFSTKSSSMPPQTSDIDTEEAPFDVIVQSTVPTILSPVKNLSGGLGGPSPLSGFLAPGGQLPPVRSHGRPTITKVTMSPSLATSSGAMPVAEEIQGPVPPRQNFDFHTPSTEKPKQNNSIAWYYKNYNNTDLKPYIGPGMYRPSKSNKTSQLTINVLLLIFTTLVMN